MGNGIRHAAAKTNMPKIMAIWRRNRIIAGGAWRGGEDAVGEASEISGRAAAGGLWRRWRRGISNKQLNFLKRIWRINGMRWHQNEEKMAASTAKILAKKMAYHQTGIGERGVSGGGGESKWRRGSFSNLQNWQW
jgi:hypothetical protein